MKVALSQPTFIGSSLLISVMRHLLQEIFPAVEYLTKFSSTCQLKTEQMIIKLKISLQISLKLKGDLIQQDYDTCKRLQWENNIYGFVESCDITSRSVFVILLDEGSVKLYHAIREKGILYFYATGSIM